MTPERLERLGRRLVIIGVVVAPPNVVLVYLAWRLTREAMPTGILGVWLLLLSVVLIAFGIGAQRSARHVASERAGDNVQ